MLQEHVEGDGGVALKPDLSKLTREGLIWLLRHREAWPEGFEFEFDDCDTCANDSLMG
jgi:hypothetical protein